MKNKIKNLQTKKLIKEYIYLLSDEEYKKEIIEGNKQKFLQEINDRKKDLGIKNVQDLKEETELKLNNKKKDVKNNKNYLSKNIKKLYREIVKETHPDKKKSKHSLETYLQAKESYENGNFIGLYLISVDLGLNFQLETEDDDLIKLNIEDKKKYLSNIEQSYLWIWLNAKNESEKKDIINIFINNTSKNKGGES